MMIIAQLILLLQSLNLYFLYQVIAQNLLNLIMQGKDSVKFQIQK